MERLEDNSVISPSLELTSLPEGLRVKTPTYELFFDSVRPQVKIVDNQGNVYAALSVFGGIDMVGARDESLELPILSYEQEGDELRIRMSHTSSVWDKKEQVWVCRPDYVQMYFEVEGEGNITQCDYFAGHYADQTTGSGRFASQSYFQSVFNPEPTTAERRAHPAAQPSSMNVTGLARAGREDWFFTPAPYCVGLNLKVNTNNELPADSPWLMLGAAAPVEKQHFTAVHYDGEDGAFSLRADYEGHTEVRGAFRSPSVLMHFANDPYEGLTDHAAHAYRSGLLDEHSSPSPVDWWKKPIFCGWGAQAELADATEQKTAQDFATQSIYDQFLVQLAEHDLHPGTITIDDKWQQTYGENKVDEQKWPNLTDWIEQRHKVGQKVLLWLKAWDNEGLPDEWCVANQAGRAITVDPSHPEYQKNLREQVDRMLGRDGYNADGFKIDFTARTPSGQNLQRHGKEWGTSLLHRYLKTIYDQAKITKPDALIVTHTPNAGFNDVTDMIRLNDVNCGQPVVPQMQHRAKVARAACPDKLIDTDNWPMPNIEQWREYAKVQPRLGVMALYFTETVAGSKLQPQDYVTIRQGWAEV